MGGYHQANQFFPHEPGLEVSEFWECLGTIEFAFDDRVDGFDPKNSSSGSLGLWIKGRSIKHFKESYEYENTTRMVWSHKKGELIPVTAPQRVWANRVVSHVTEYNVSSLSFRAQQADDRWDQIPADRDTKVVNIDLADVEKLLIDKFGREVKINNIQNQNSGSLRMSLSLPTYANIRFCHSFEPLKNAGYTRPLVKSNQWVAE